MNASSSSDVPVISNTKLPGMLSTSRACITSASRKRLEQALAVAGHLDQGQLALDMRPLGGQVQHPLHRHQLGEQGLDLLDHELAAGGDDVDPRQAADLVDRGYRQAVDIVAAAGEQADDPGQDTRLVVDERHDGVTPLFLTRCHESSGALR